MQQRSSAVVYVGMTYPHGIMRVHAFLAVEIQRKVSLGEPYDFYFASTDGETHQNAWPMIEEAFADGKIIKTHAFEDLADQVCALARRYDKVLVHAGGGWGQTKFFVKARKRLGRILSRRIILVSTTHAFRNDSALRIPMSAFQYALYRLFYRMVVFQCQYAADIFVGGRSLLRSGKGVIIPLGCETFAACAKDAPNALVEAGLDRVLLDETLFKFVYLAAFRPGKMHTWLVHVIAPVLRTHPDARVLLCGSGVDSVVKATKAAISEAGVGDQVILPGRLPRETIPWLLQHVNCAFVPSRSETFGHNFLEPMFAGIPVLGTPVGIGREIIKDGKTGFLIDLNNAESLQENMTYLIEHPDVAAQMGRAAKRQVSTTFRHSDVAEQLCRLYEKLLTEE